MKHCWLRDWPWETVVAINAGLCRQKHALHKATSDGYETTKKLWDEASGLELTLRETLDLLRQCHKLAPFCFYNGNTFAAIGRTLVQDLGNKLSPLKAHALRSVVGHYIAGTAGVEELSQVLDEIS